MRRLVDALVISAVAGLVVGLVLFVATVVREQMDATMAEDRRQDAVLIELLQRMGALEEQVRVLRDFTIKGRALPPYVAPPTP